MLKYRRLRGDMIEVFKIVHNYYESKAAVKLNFNTFNTTRGNMYNCRNLCHYNIGCIHTVAQSVNQPFINYQPYTATQKPEFTNVPCNHSERTERP